MRISKSIYGGSSVYHTNLEKGVGNLISDLENYTTLVINGLHIPGSSTKLKGTLRSAVSGLRNYEFDLYERLISFGRTLRILVDSTSAMNKELNKKIEGPLHYLVKTYNSIAFRTNHKEITETAQRLMKDISDDPNEVNIFYSY